MLSPSSGALGLGRAVLWAAVVLALGLLAHGEAGGHLPATETIVLLGALLLVMTACAVRRQIRWPVGLALAGAGQLLVHQALSFLGGACAPSAPAVAGGHAHVVVGQLAHGTCVASPAGLSPAMLGWHVVATVAAVGLLIGTERAAWMLASWLARTTGTGSVRLPAVQKVPGSGALGVLGVLVSTVDVHVAPERGPPSSSCTMRLVA